MSLNGEKIGKTDLTGINLRIAQDLPQHKIGKFTPEVFGLIGFGQGSEKYSYSEPRYYESVDGEVTLMTANVGVNLNYEVSKEWTVFFGAKLGLGYMDATYDIDTSDERMTLGNNDIGFNYGIGVGAEYAFTNRHSVTFGADYLGTTARPKVTLGEDSYKTKGQNYLNFSIGYKYTF